MKLKSFILTFIILFFSVKKIFACDCNLLFDYKKSQEVFIGTVIKIELYKKNNYHTLNTIEIQKTYKGKLKAKKKIRILSGRDACGYNDWKIGENYIIFIEGKEKKLRMVNMCTLTTRIHFEYDENGNWIGQPSKEEIEKWSISGKGHMLREQWMIE